MGKRNSRNRKTPQVKSMQEFCNDLKIAKIDEVHELKQSELEKKYKEQEDKMIILMYGNYSTEEGPSQDSK